MLIQDTLRCSAQVGAGLHKLLGLRGHTLVALEGLLGGVADGVSQDAPLVESGVQPLLESGVLVLKRQLQNH